MKLERGTLGDLHRVCWLFLAVQSAYEFFLGAFSPPSGNGFKFDDFKISFHRSRSSRNHVISAAESMLFFIGLPLQEALEAKIFYRPISSIFSEIK
jgi:hypothetical protein